MIPDSVFQMFDDDFYFSFFFLKNIFGKNNDISQHGLLKENENMVSASKLKNSLYILFVYISYSSYYLSYFVRLKFYQYPISFYEI